MLPRFDPFASSRIKTRQHQQIESTERKLHHPASTCQSHKLYTAAYPTPLLFAPSSSSKTMGAGSTPIQPPRQPNVRVTRTTLGVGQPWQLRTTECPLNRHSNQKSASPGFLAALACCCRYFCPCIFILLKLPIYYSNRTQKFLEPAVSFTFCQESCALVLSSG